MDEHVVSKAQCNNLAVQGIGKLDSKRAGTKGIKKSRTFIINILLQLYIHV